MLDRTLIAKTHDLGGLFVHRVLPQAGRRSVGPFVFLDHMGPHTTPPGVGFDVRPHPHIGLATLTYLYAGEQMHRDSMGVVARVIPGDVNLMIAGSGVVHSERSTPEGRASGGTMHGLQYWLALPAANEDDAPSFQHADAARLPHIAVQNGRATLALGTFGGSTSPVTFPARALLLDVSLEEGGEITVGGEEAELGAYVTAGEADIDGTAVPLHQLALLDRTPTCIRARGACRLAIFGGDALEAPRKMFWNFVATDDARIAAASQRWRERKFPPIPGDDDEFIPLPDVGHQR